MVLRGRMTVPTKLVLILFSWSLEIVLIFCSIWFNHLIFWTLIFRQGKLFPMKFNYLDHGYYMIKIKKCQNLFSFWSIMCPDCSFTAKTSLDQYSDWRSIFLYLLHTLWSGIWSGIRQFPMMIHKTILFAHYKYWLKAFVTQPYEPNNQN